MPTCCCQILLPRTRAWEGSSLEETFGLATMLVATQMTEGFWCRKVSSACPGRSSGSIELSLQSQMWREGEIKEIQVQIWLYQGPVSHLVLFIFCQPQFTHLSKEEMSLCDFSPLDSTLARSQKTRKRLVPLILNGVIFFLAWNHQIPYILLFICMMGIYQVSA